MPACAAELAYPRQKRANQIGTESGFDSRPRLEMPRSSLSSCGDMAIHKYELARFHLRKDVLQKVHTEAAGPASVPFRHLGQSIKEFYLRLDQNRSFLGFHARAFCSRSDADGKNKV